MKKLVAFGDSFVNLEFYTSDEKNWVTQLADELSFPVLNYGHFGSALGYSLNEFFKYQSSEDYDSEDIIIFVTTSSNRLFTSDMPDPKLGVLHFAITNSDYYLNQTEQNWIYNNADYGLWAIDKIYHPSINYEIEKTVSCVRMWADAHPNLVILIRGADDDTYNPNSNKFVESIQSTSNFVSLSNNIGLVAASNLEFINNEESGFRGNSQKECRTNHFSTPNLEILVKMMNDVITYRSQDYYDLSKLNRHFL